MEQKKTEPPFYGTKPDINKHMEQSQKDLLAEWRDKGKPLPDKPREK